uniref:Uncharacterized protein n=1 Tax=Physcomitrium patens TaxID=3218 RepID=A0A2K1KWV5_PHYPA|nr:hypothetical protein PHYPA_005244 [Physcomitrium patens]
MQRQASTPRMRDVPLLEETYKNTS